MAKNLSKNNKEITGRLEPKYWVQKSDPLFLMRSVPFSLGELKILDTYISRINASDESRDTVIFTKEEYENLMGLTCVDYRTLKKNTEGLLGKIVTLEMPNQEYLQFVLFEQAQYHKDEYGKPIIELTCTRRAKDLFFCIGKYHYFKYALENVVKLTRKASYLLYIYIHHNRYRREWEIILEELRDTILNCKGQESYQEFKEFKRAVLNPAVKEINEKTDCQIEYEVIKRGRRVAKIKFIYHTTKPQTNEQLSLLPQGLERRDEINYGGELANLLGGCACNDEFTVEQVRVLQDLVMKAVGRYADNLQYCDYLTEKIHTMNLYDSKKKIKDRFSYLRKMIEKDI